MMIMQLIDMMLASWEREARKQLQKNQPVEKIDATALLFREIIDQLSQAFRHSPFI
jgi:hypothetical protein